MNKKLIAGCLAAIVATAALAWIIFGGSKKDDYASVIPDNAVLVARMAPVEFLEKNNIELDELADKVGEGKRFVKMGLSYLKGCGVDITRPFYFFVDGNACIGMCAAVSDVKDLKSVIKTELHEELLDKDGYNWVKMGNGGDAWLCFDSDKMLFYGNPRQIGVMQTDIIELMKQDEDKSVLSTDLYKQLIDSKKSFAANLDYEAAMDITKSLAGNSSDMAAMAATGLLVPPCNMLMALDAEGSKVQCTTDVFPKDSKAEKEYDELMSKIPGITGDLVGKGLKNPFAWLCFNFPGKKLLEFVKQIPGAEEALAQISQQVDITTLLGSFNGDITLSMNNNLKSEDPEFLLMASTENNKYVDVLNTLTKLNGGDMALVSDGGSSFHVTQKVFDWSSWNDDYIELDDDEELFDEEDDDYFDDLDELTDDDMADFSSPSPAPTSTSVKTMAYIYNKDNIFMLTNSENIKNTPQSGSQAVEKYKSDMMGCKIYGFVDIQEFVKQVKLVQEHVDDRETAILSVLKGLKDVVLKVSDRHMELTLNTMDDKNFVDFVCDAIQSVSSTLGLR